MTTFDYIKEELKRGDIDNINQLLLNECVGIEEYGYLYRDIDWEFDKIHTFKDLKKNIGNTFKSPYILINRLINQNKIIQN